MGLRRRGYLVEAECLIEETDTLHERRKKGKKSGLEKLKEKYGIEKDGYSTKKKGYCGWSHRAFYCFPIGHKVKEGHLPKKFVGKTVKTKGDSKRFARAFANEVS